MTQDDILRMAREAGASDLGINAASLNVRAMFERFAALVAAAERKRLFGAGPRNDGEMRVQLTRWEGGECFTSAMHFTSEQTHLGPDNLPQLAIDKMDRQLDGLIRARDTQ